MMLLHSYAYNTHERADIARLKRTYRLYGNGMFRTCGYDEAIKLLITGKWFDRTSYLPNEEVLNYGKHKESRRQRICSDQSEASGEREEPRHQQHQPNLSHNFPREENAREGNGSRSPRSEVRKRGRPKAGK